MLRSNWAYCDDPHCGAIVGPTGIAVGVHHYHREHAPPVVTVERAAPDLAPCRVYAIQRDGFCHLAGEYRGRANAEALGSWRAARYPRIRFVLATVKTCEECQRDTTGPFVAGACDCDRCAACSWDTVSCICQPGS